MSNSRVDTIVRGGQVVTSSLVYDASIAITGEKIVATKNYHIKWDTHLKISADAARITKNVRLFHCCSGFNNTAIAM